MPGTTKKVRVVAKQKRARKPAGTKVQASRGSAAVLIKQGGAGARGGPTIIYPPASSSSSSSSGGGGGGGSGSSGPAPFMYGNPGIYGAAQMPVAQPVKGSLETLVLEQLGKLQDALRQSRTATDPVVAAEFSELRGAVAEALQTSREVANGQGSLATLVGNLGQAVGDVRQSQFNVVQSLGAIVDAQTAARNSITSMDMAMQGLQQQTNDTRDGMANLAMQLANQYASQNTELSRVLDGVSRELSSGGELVRSSGQQQSDSLREAVEYLRLSNQDQLNQLADYLTNVVVRGAQVNDVLARGQATRVVNDNRRAEQAVITEIQRTQQMVADMPQGQPQGVQRNVLAGLTDQVDAAGGLVDLYNRTQGAQGLVELSQSMNVDAAQGMLQVAQQYQGAQGLAQMSNQMDTRDAAAGMVQAAQQYQAAQGLAGMSAQMDVQDAAQGMVSAAQQYQGAWGLANMSN